MIMVGQLAFGTFQVAILTEVTGLEPLVMVPIYLSDRWRGRRDRHLARGTRGRLERRSGDHDRHRRPDCVLCTAAVRFGERRRHGHRPVPRPGLRLRLLDADPGAHSPRRAGGPRLAATFVSTAYNVAHRGRSSGGRRPADCGCGLCAASGHRTMRSTVALALAATSLTLSRRGIASMPLALVSLFAAAFAIGTSEFVIAGILPAASTDLGISIPTAGLLVSLYALGVAIGGPLLATFTGRFPRKLLPLIYVSIFTGRLHLLLPSRRTTRHCSSPAC